MYYIIYTGSDIFSMLQIIMCTVSIIVVLILEQTPKKNCTNTFCLLLDCYIALHCNIVLCSSYVNYIVIVVCD